MVWTIEGAGAAGTFEEKVEVPEEGSLWVERPILAREGGTLSVRVEWAQEVPDRFPENDAGTEGGRLPAIAQRRAPRAR